MSQQVYDCTFHIFHQIEKGMSDQDKTMFAYGKLREHAYTNQNNIVTPTDHAAGFRNTIAAMKARPV